MSKTVFGSPGMIEQPVIRSYIQGRGWTWTRRWVGPKENAYGLEQQLIAAGYDVRTQEDGPNAIVEGMAGGRDDSGGGDNETPIPTWERYVNRFEKSIYEHPEFASLTDAQKRTVKEAVDAFQRGEEPETAPTGTADTLFTLIKAGVETFYQFQPVVRLTQTVSNRYDRSSASATGNVGKILTRNQMASLEGAPISVLDDKAVPSGLSSIARYGYLKCDSQVVQQAQNQWQIVTEWEAGFWSTTLYGNAS